VCTSAIKKLTASSARSVCRLGFGMAALVIET
jgi:hypothetical protein